MRASTLPPALAPWAAPLAAFAPELALTLGHWARRIAVALGPAGASAAGTGEPDGVAGLARRGSYERLLLSEWLLADALPHEFLRRAAAGEHLFLDRGVRTTRGERRQVALLDAGPDQLGAPRLAQLALLVVLAARAGAARARFAWGIVQDPGAGLADGLGEPEVRRFLSARSGRAPDAALLGAWDEAVSSPEPAERWLVGGPALAGAAQPRAVRVAIEDVVDPELREVRLEVWRAGARREVTLPLPPRADCTRLLRDPFRAAVAPVAATPGRIVPGAALLWAPSGRRIAARLDSGLVVDAHVPGSPREPPGRARFHRQEDLVGFGWAGRRQVVLASRSSQGLFLNLGRGVSRFPASVDGLALPDAAAPDVPLAACLAPPGRKAGLWVHYPSGLLLATGSGGTGLRRVAERAPAALRGSGGLVVVTAAGAALELVVEGWGGRRTAVPLGAGSGRAFLAESPPGWLRVAVEDGDGAGSWRTHVFQYDGSRPAHLPEQVLRPPSGTRPVGVTTAPGETALLLLEDDHRDFTLLDGAGSRLVHGAGAEVVTVAVSPAHRAFAYTTRAGALVVYSLEQQAVVLQLAPGDDRDRDHAPHPAPRRDRGGAA